MGPIDHFVQPTVSGDPESGLGLAYVVRQTACIGVVSGGIVSMTSHTLPSGHTASESHASYGPFSEQPGWLRQVAVVNASHRVATPPHARLFAQRLALLGVGVAGGSGSGKTSVTNKILEQLDASRVLIIQHDSYYRDLAMYDGATPDQINFDKREFNAWIDQAIRRYAAAWAADFFPRLWRTLDETDPDAARLAWLQSLRDKGLLEFQDAIQRYPFRTGRQFRARVQAERVFHGSLYNHFPQLKEERHATD